MKMITMTVKKALDLIRTRADVELSDSIPACINIGSEQFKAEHLKEDLKFGYL